MPRQAESNRGEHMPFVTGDGGELFRTQEFAYGVTRNGDWRALGTLRLLPYGHTSGQQRDKRQPAFYGTYYAQSRNAPKMLIDSHSVQYYHEGKSGIVPLGRREGAGLEATEG